MRAGCGGFDPKPRNSFCQAYHGGSTQHIDELCQTLTRVYLGRGHLKVPVVRVGLPTIVERPFRNGLLVHGEDLAHQIPGLDKLAGNVSRA